MAGELEPKTSKPAGAQPVGGWRSGKRFRAGLADLAGLVWGMSKVMVWANREAQSSAAIGVGAANEFVAAIGQPDEFTFAKLADDCVPRGPTVLDDGFEA